MFSKVVFPWTGREAGETGCSFVQIEIGSLILSFIEFGVVLQLWGLCYTSDYFLINMVSFYFMGSSWQRFKVLERVFDRGEEWGKEYPNSSE